MQYTTKFLLATLLINIGLCITAQASNITISSNGQSDYTIVIPSKPALSVKNAAKELQRDIKQSTGTKLAIKHGNHKVTEPFISLGATKQAKTAHIFIKGITPGGFRIVTRNGNLYIRGLDTVAKVNWGHRGYGNMTPQPKIPGPQYTKHGGWSNGTANGVYTFLEKRLGVRWLMPGPLGLVVPQHSVLTIPKIDRVDQPVFIVRNLGGLEKVPQRLHAVHLWQIHQKLGFSFRLNGNHNMWKTLVGATRPVRGGKALKKLKAIYKKHPDWFAMNKQGKRPFPNIYYDKLETTNQGLVKYFANKAAKALETHPHMNTYSLSLSDGRHYSQSPASKALYDPSPNGGRFPSVTPLILKWYRDISNEVAKQDPNALLAGFIYQQYLYPPKQGSKTLPDNFIPYIAPSFDYGFKLYRPDIQKDFKYVLGNWAKLAPPTWFYFDFPNMVGPWQGFGMVMPPATSILNFVFPHLLKYHIKGAYFRGDVSWSMAALTNYIDAKLLWNPHLNANDIKKDWLTHAYGKQAGAVMNQFYTRLSGWLSDYYNHYHSAGIRVYERLFQKMFAPHDAQLEAMFLKAASQPMTTTQKQRLDLIKKNLIVLQWRLRNAGYLPASYHSALTRSSAQVAKLLFQWAPGHAFNLFPVLWYWHWPGRKQTAVKLGKSNNMAQSSAKMNVPNAGYVLFYPVDNGDIAIHLKNVHPSSSFLTFRIYRSEASRKRLRMSQQGILYSGQTITIHAKAKTPYYFGVVAHGVTPWRRETKDARYVLHISDAALATASYKDNTVTLHPIKNNSASVYVYAPGKLHLSSSQTSGGTVILGTQSRADSARQVFMRKHPHIKMAKKLDKKWHFKTDPHKTGLKHGFAKPGFNANSWETLAVTNHWQNQGFPNYHGTAWYRKTFKAPKIKKNRKYYLFFGNIDGNAVIYVNGHFAYQSKLGKDGHAWDEPLTVNITKLLHSGKNTIAIKVTKESQASGIYRGVALLTK